MKVIIYRVEPPLRKLCYSWGEALKQGDSLWNDSVLVTVIISGITFIYGPRRNKRDFMLRQVMIEPYWYAIPRREVAVKKECLSILSRFIVCAVRKYVVASRLTQTYDNRVLQKLVDEAISGFVRKVKTNEISAENEPRM
jgi:hypothetical protein